MVFKLIQDSAYCSQVATRCTVLVVPYQGAAQVVQIMDHQMYPDRFTQLLAGGMETQRLHGVAVQTRHRTGFVGHAEVDEFDLGRLLVFAEQLDINIGQVCGRAVPDRPAQVRPETRQPLHPEQGQAAQGQQFGRLGLGAEDGDVLAHRILDLVIARQGGAWREAELAHSAAFGRAVFQAFFHHHLGRHGGNFV